MTDRWPKHSEWRRRGQILLRFRKGAFKDPRRWELELSTPENRTFTILQFSGSQGLAWNFRTAFANESASCTRSRPVNPPMGLVAEMPEITFSRDTD